MLSRARLAIGRPSNLGADHDLRVAFANRTGDDHVAILVDELSYVVLEPWHFVVCDKGLLATRNFAKLNLNAVLDRKRRRWSSEWYGVWTQTCSNLLDQRQVRTDGWNSTDMPTSIASRNSPYS